MIVDGAKALGMKTTFDAKYSNEMGFGISGDPLLSSGVSRKRP